MMELAYVCLKTLHTLPGMTQALRKPNAAPRVSVCFSSTQVQKTSRDPLIRYVSWRYESSVITPILVLLLFVQ